MSDNRRSEKSASEKSDKVPYGKSAATNGDVARRDIIRSMHLTVDTALAVAGIVLALIGILMALPPLLQMFCGRPQLDIAADEFTGPDGKQLLIHLKNRSTSRILRKFGVERTIGNVLGFFDIQEQGTNKFIQKDIAGVMLCAPLKEVGLQVPALPGFSVGMSIVQTKGATTWICDAKAETMTRIGVGDYTVFATIFCGEQLHKIRKNFKVGTAEHLTFWV
jgi:hypothetical protein